LEFQLAHARACDAVHTPLDVERLEAALEEPLVVVRSAAPDRTTYLKDPGAGRRLGPLPGLPPPGAFDLALVLADGLSARAVEAHAPALVKALRRRLVGWRLAPLVTVLQGRVAIGDPIGAQLGARMAAVLIGERPGLSAADSLGCYLTFDPQPGRRDSERNCVSNIREPGGLGIEAAADKVAWLLMEMKTRGLSGVRLKDREETLSPPGRLTGPDAAKV
jgi:ethanolamine ammonia-lyase small subunit